ncbi:MAG: zinc ribbon domain-containing protein [Bellilinea sp.]
MRRLILVFFIIAGLFLARPIQAQSDLVLESMDIGLWPEYDRPDVLVIYRMTLANEVPLPAQMSIRIPREAGAPYNLAMKDMDGLLYNLAYTSEVQGEWLKVTFTTPSAELQLEYYDPQLIKEESAREFEFIWPGDYAVNNMLLAIQQPLTATEMQVFPDFGEGIPGEDGLTYFSQQVGSVNAGTPITIRFSYNKPDDALSFGSQSVQPVQAASTGEAGRVDASTILPWIIGGAGLLLIAGGLVWFGITRNRAAIAGHTGKRRHRATRQIPLKTINENSPSVYCSQCGRKASSTDVYCRSCGNRLRTD